MRTNQSASSAHRAAAGTTFEGGPAGVTKPEAQLLRQVATCLLYEDTYYQKGSQIADEIAATCALVSPEYIAEVAVRAREEYSLRHVPLFLAAQLERRRGEAPGLTRRTVARVVQRADELAEFLAIYAKVYGVDPKATSGPKSLKGTMGKQVQRGLADAFVKFSAYQLAKYNRDGAVRLRDVMFLCHPKPRSAEQKAVWEKLIKGELEAPDTWEVALSGGADKKATWERLLAENKLGPLALVRNLRNMTGADVDRRLVTQALSDCRPQGILPYQFVSAYRAAPEYTQGIEKAMLKCLAETPSLRGQTVLLVDVSDSMNVPLSEKSTLTRMDAASALAILLREIGDDVRILTFSNELVEVGAVRGLGVIEGIKGSQDNSGTYLAKALDALRKHIPTGDRLIVITDEQTHDGNRQPWMTHSYLVNVAPNRPGLSLHGGWERINGFSERLTDYIRLSEEIRES